jgi:hypothetical protein
MRRYWGYRINTDEISFFRNEIENNRLRQGWGWDLKQDLRSLTMDEGARRNLSIFNKVKKGDILLVPRLPTWGDVAIIEAIEDFSSGYQFEIDKERNDYGHIFPARLLKSFTRNNENIPGSIRSAIKNISRFWSIDHLGPDIEPLLSKDPTELRDRISLEERFQNAVSDSFSESFNSTRFKDYLYSKMTKHFSNEEWEYALVEGLKEIFPEPIIVERIGGISEIKHGTDILIRIPGLLNYQYGIAIQVKDYEGIVGSAPLEQIRKSDYLNDENLKIIDKILVIIRAPKDVNETLTSALDVKVIFASELKELLLRIGKSMIGIEYER